MRKSYEGLLALVKNQLGQDPLSGELFVFINRKRTQMKILYFDRGSYCVWGKRLFRLSAGIMSSASASIWSTAIRCPGR